MNTATIETTTATLQDRFNQAMKDIRKGGVKARRNVSGCCRSCISAEGTHAEGQAIIWHFGGQGHEFGFKSSDGKAYYRSDLDNAYNWHRASSIDGIYFNHDGLTTDGKINEKGQFVLDTFAKHGIVTDWDGSDFKCIEVDFDASEAK